MKIQVTLGKFRQQYYPNVRHFIPMIFVGLGNLDYIHYIDKDDPTKIRHLIVGTPEVEFEDDIIVAPCITENGYAFTSVPASKLEMVDED